MENFSREKNYYKDSLIVKHHKSIQRAGGRERNPVCLLPCHSHCRSLVPQPHDGQAFFE